LAASLSTRRRGHFMTGLYGNLSSEAALSNALPGDNRTQWGCWTRRIFPVSARDINASVRANN
jgi:hypothetical protein